MIVVGNGGNTDAVATGVKFVIAPAETVNTAAAPAAVAASARSGKAVMIG